MTAGQATRRASAPARVEIQGPAGRLEALVEIPSETSAAVAVVCHPHPLHGGTMTNKVAHTLARAFYRLGAASVRFNFRGVGESDGAYDDGVGEREDALAAIRWACAERPGSRLAVCGFSFGAAVAAAVAERANAAALVTVALPVERLPQDFTPPSCPWLIVHGAQDEIVPLDEVQAWRERRAAHARLEIVDAATHFFHGKLTVLSDRVEAFARADAGFGG